MKTPVRLLLIDDNPDDRTLARRKLEQELAHLQVHEITDAAQFEQALEQGNFDLVITDYRLRWTDGLSILQAVKNHYPDCPVVMFTGTGNEEVAVEAMKSGLEDYIIKTPNHYTRLAVAVRAALERTMERQALKEAESRYQRLFEGVPIGLYRMTPTGQVLEANSALLQLLGYDNLQTLLDTGLIEHHFDLEAQRLWQHRIETQGMIKDLEMPLYRCDCLTLPRLKARGILSSFPFGFYQTTYNAGLRQHCRGRTVLEREFPCAPRYLRESHTLSPGY